MCSLENICLQYTYLYETNASKHARRKDVKSQYLTIDVRIKHTRSVAGMWETTTDKINTREPLYFHLPRRMEVFLDEQRFEFKRHLYCSLKTQRLPTCLARRRLSSRVCERLKKGDRTNLGY